MFSRYRRNEKQSIETQTFKVGETPGVTAHPDLYYARRQVVETTKRAGNLFAHWRKYTPEFNNGRCPVCWNPRTSTGADPNCPQCYGVGFDGGYAKPSIQYMIVRHSDRRAEFTNSGYLRMVRMISRSPYLPNIATGDVVGEIQNLEGEIVTFDRFLVEQNVDKQRFRLADNFVQPNTFDHLDPEPDVVSYNFEATRIPKHSDEEMRRIEYFIPLENPVWLTDLRN